MRKETLVFDFNLLYYEYDPRANCFFRLNRSDSDYALELVEITYYLNHNNIKYYVDSYKDIFLKVETGFIFNLKKTLFPL